MNKYAQYFDPKKMTSTGALHMYYSLLDKVSDDERALLLDAYCAAADAIDERFKANPDLFD